MGEEILPVNPSSQVSLSSSLVDSIAFLTVWGGLKSKGQLQIIPMWELQNWCLRD